jgi:hypothetical protein
MKSHPMVLGAFSLLLTAACSRAGQKVAPPRPPIEQAQPPSKPTPKPPPAEARSIPASSEGALSILGIHPVSATLLERPSHLLRLSCTFDHSLEGEVVARFLDGSGKERGRSQEHIKTDGTSGVLEFKIPGSVPMSEIASVHLKLPE